MERSLGVWGKLVYAMHDDNDSLTLWNDNHLVEMILPPLTVSKGLFCIFCCTIVELSGASKNFAGILINCLCLRICVGWCRCGILL